MATSMKSKALFCFARIRLGGILQAPWVGLSRQKLFMQSTSECHQERSAHAQTQLLSHSHTPESCLARSGILSQACVPHLCLRRTFGSHSGENIQGDSGSLSNTTNCQPERTEKAPARDFKSDRETQDVLSFDHEHGPHSADAFQSQSGDSFELDACESPHNNNNNLLHVKVQAQTLQEGSEDHSASSADSADIQNWNDLPARKPVEPSYNLAVYVSQSEVLQRLVGLGVDLSAVEKIPEAAECVLQGSWENDIQPRLLFLRDVGVQDGDMGKVLSKNPLLLKEELKDLQARVDYFKSKKFSTEDIGRVVTSAPVTLLMPVTVVDKKLGFLQKTFGLSGDEVRAVAIRLPKIIPWKLQKLKDTRFYIKEMLGFSDRELKTLLLAYPKVYLTDKHQLGKRFDFLHNVMGLSHKDLVLWPAVFRTRLHLLQQRHRFLLSVGRAQYDPTKENYVSLKALVSGKDRDFCFHVAKASTTQFNNFLKAV